LVVMIKARSFISHQLVDAQAMFYNDARVTAQDCT